MDGFRALSLAFVAAVMSSAAVAAVPEIPEELQGVNAWGGRRPHPAVVNPVGREADENLISLRGEWDFCTAKPNCPGMYFRGMVTNNCRRIQVPSCWEAQGVGTAGVSVAYLCNDNSPRAMRHVHQGTGLYRRTVKIPEAWRGKRVWIKSGLIWSQGWIRVNGKEIAHVDSCCGTYKWDITDLVTPGSNAEVFVMANNDLPNRAGSHIASGRFGGIVRDIELEATPQVYIDDAWVRGDYDRHMAEAHVTVGGVRDLGLGIRVRVTVEDETVERAIEQSNNLNNQTILKVPLGNFKAWSPEHPNLYWAKIELLEDGQVTMTRRERFGVRKFEVRGKEFYLNGRPFFFRGFGDNHPFPLTGAHVADRELHKAHLAVARAAGYNYVRLHTYIAFPEYFEAADELGIIVQPELPYYGNSAEDGFMFDPMRDVRERWEHFRRYPSWGVSSQGNEGIFCDRLRTFMYAWQKAVDPDRLVQAQDGRRFEPTPDGSPYTDFQAGPIVVWERGGFNAAPFICHEYLNLTVKSDYRIADDYTGLWLPPALPADRAKWLAQFGLDMSVGSELQDAQHALQGMWLKRGLEIARADPYCDGYCQWTICDTTVPYKSFYTAQGLFDPFWRPKRNGLTPSDVARFNSATCILLDNEGKTRVFEENPHYEPISYSTGGLAWEGTNRVYRSGETIPLAFVLSHYGERPLADATVAWRFVTPEGRTLLAGEERIGGQPVGPAHEVAKRTVTVPSVVRPVKARCEVTVADGTETVCANDWDFWFFPARPRRIPAPGLYVAKGLEGIAARYSDLCDDLAQAKAVMAPAGSDAANEALKRGINLLSVTNMDAKANIKLGWWWIGKQCGTVVRKHPTFGEFPHEPCLSPLLWRIFKEGVDLPHADFAQKDLVVLTEGADGCYLHLAERTTEEGARHLLAAGLDLAADLPEAVALTDELVGYLR